MASVLMDDDGEGAFFCIEIGKVKQQKATIEEKDVVTSPAVVGDSVVSSFFCEKPTYLTKIFGRRNGKSASPQKILSFGGGNPLTM